MELFEKKNVKLKNNIKYVEVGKMILIPWIRIQKDLIVLISVSYNLWHVYLNKGTEIFFIPKTKDALQKVRVSLKGLKPRKTLERQTLMCSSKVPYSPILIKKEH